MTQKQAPKVIDSGSLEPLGVCKRMYALGYAQLH